MMGLPYNTCGWVIWKFNMSILVFIYWFYITVIALFWITGWLAGYICSVYVFEIISPIKKKINFLLNGIFWIPILFGTLVYSILIILTKYWDY
jgi:hypothetical protein